MRKFTKFIQGIFNPVNPTKYTGHFPIQFRSSWEKGMMGYFDKNPNIISWTSESVIIPYCDKTRGGEVHRYVLDFTCKAKDKDGKIKTLWIEIKPSSQSQMPVKGKKTEKRYLAECIIYARNVSKWEAAKQMAAKRGAEFVVLTEKSLPK